MGYALAERWGRVFEMTAGYGQNLTITAADQDLQCGSGGSPTWADVDYGTVVGAYLDMVILSYQAEANSNYITSDSSYAKLEAVGSGGHSNFDCISDLHYACNCRLANVVYPGTRFYGDENFYTLFSSGTSHYWGHAMVYELHNIRAVFNPLYLNSFYFIWRFYMR